MYKDHSEAAGLRILAFPCNQFGGQVPALLPVKPYITCKVPLHIPCQESVHQCTLQYTLLYITLFRNLYTNVHNTIMLTIHYCTDHNSQEPGTDQEIKAFAADTYNVTFDMFSKIEVNGSSAHPLWVYLKDQQGGFLMNAIKWNFTKFVVDKEGQPKARFGPTDNPKPKVEQEVMKYL